MAAQYYPKTNSIRIGIADVGIGIRASISRSHHVRDDAHALQLALMPGVTGTTVREGGTTQNAGAGLFFIKSIAAINSDFFMLYSHQALFKLLKQRSSKRHVLRANPLEDRHSLNVDIPAWPGTAVGIDMVQMCSRNSFSKVVTRLFRKSSLLFQNICKNLSKLLQTTHARGWCARLVRCRFFHIDVLFDIIIP